MNIGEVEIGKPWQYKENSIGIVVPLLRKNQVKRNYKTVEEVKEMMNIKDTGNIDSVEISSKVNEPVFIRSGTMFEGVGTQSRTPTTSIVIIPNQQPMKVPVKCIHASHHISSGSNFKVAGSIPHYIGYAAFGPRASQSRVWSSVSMQASSVSHHAMHLSDNLIDNVRKIETFKKDIGEAVKNYPILKNQVGIVVLDFNGVVGLEMFDNSESWAAVCKDIINKYSDTITQLVDSPLFSLNEESIKPKILEFLKKLTEAKEEIIFQADVMKTILLENGDIIGECTSIDGRMIHLMGMKKKDEERTYGSVAPNNLPFTPQNWTTRGSNYSVLSALGDGSRRFSEIEKTTKLSPATVSKNLSKFHSLGFIDKSAEIINNKAREVYSLTSNGKNAFFTMHDVRKKLMKLG